MTGEPIVTKKLEPTYTVEDLPYCCEHNGKTVYLFGLHHGEPGTREIYHRKIYLLNNGKNHLGMTKQCPCCNGTNTEYIREDGSTRWYICYTCEIAFEPEIFYDLSECPDEVEIWEN